MRALLLILVIGISWTAICSIENRKLDKTKVRQFDHKGYRTCAMGAYTKHAGCMTAALFSSAKRKACRMTLASRLAACRASDAVVLTRSHLANKDSHLAAHMDIMNTMCIYKADAARTLCRTKASLSGTELEKAKKLAECDLEWNTMIAECNSKRHLGNLQLKASSHERHALFCESNAKHSWFWCNFWAKLRGGSDLASHAKQCENEYDAAIRKCKFNDSASSPVITAQAAARPIDTRNSTVQSTG